MWQIKVKFCVTGFIVLTSELGKKRLFGFC
jgi:hypothetical protein